MNKINPKKLLHSKWTAIKPVNKEKHFIVTEVKFDEAREGMVLSCTLEAAFSRRAKNINWHELKESDKWLHGWK